MNKPISHEGHRQRLKNRFLSEGLDSFEPHNILELLLFYSIPQKDTNELAHTLLNTFGSLRGVFEAEYEELLKINGIKENTATLLKLLPEVARAYFHEEVSNITLFDTAEKIGKYFVTKYIGETKEVVYLMMLNNGFGLIDVIKLHEGSVNSAKISPRKIVDEVVKHNAAMVVIAHNHPNGFAIPSMEDIETTSRVFSNLNTLDITLIEHFLIAGNEYLPIMYETKSFHLMTKAHKSLFRKI
ncbi:MAG: DNA repair protein RadC [Clostridia bacterium]|nr:DNA repair protein RadC [Clostridia bacterium]